MKEQILILILLCFLCHVTNGRPAAQVLTKADPNKLVDFTTAVFYLSKYGYLKINNNNTFTGKKEAVRLALMEFQTFMKIPVTGIIDKSTSNLMNRPRCGLPDKIENIYSNLKLKAFLTKNGQRKKALYQKNGLKSGVTYTWFISEHFLSSQLPVIGQFLIEYGINLWAAVTNIRFQNIKSQFSADVIMTFHKGGHGHGMPFDGPLGELAHASSVAKEIHFDDAETWTYNQVHLAYFLRPGVDPDIVQCAAHEMGHVLDFDHTQNKNSVLYPYVLHGVKGADYALDAEDVARVQKVYGTCWSNRFDAIFSNLRGDGKTYIVVGPYIYQFDNSKVSVASNSWPRANYHFWGGGFQLFDDIFHGENDRLYYLWNKWYHYDINNGLSSKRESITTNFIGLNSDNIDAAFKHIDGKVYIFKNDLVWRWDFNIASTKPNQIPPGGAEQGWPKKIATAFPGVPDNIDTVFRWNYDGNVYFFKGKHFYIWNKTANRAYGLYGTDQWKNVCDVIKCTLGTKCRSWDINTQNCGTLCAPS